MGAALLKKKVAADMRYPCCNLPISLNSCPVDRDMKVTESSESVLAGTKRPPFRLVVRAVSTNGRRLHVRPAVSEEFVVRDSVFDLIQSKAGRNICCTAGKSTYI